MSLVINMPCKILFHASSQSRTIRHNHDDYVVSITIKTIRLILSFDCAGQPTDEELGKCPAFDLLEIQFMSLFQGNW